MTSPAVVRRWTGSGLDPLPRCAAPPRSGPGPIPILGSVLRARWGRVGAVAPLGAAFLTVLVLQAGLAPHLALSQAAPDLLLASVVAVALGQGSRAGAGFGFAAGLGADLFLATPLGTSALTFTLIGHVLGQQRRPPRSGTASALCRPASSCFACRTGRRHAPEVQRSREPGAARLRRRKAARRSAVRRSVVLTGLGVGAGRMATAVAATALGGVPFPGGPGLARIAAIGALSAPLGPLAFAAVRRLPGGAIAGQGAAPESPPTLAAVRRLAGGGCR